MITDNENRWGRVVVAAAGAVADRGYAVVAADHLPGPRNLRRHGVPKARAARWFPSRLPKEIRMKAKRLNFVQEEFSFLYFFQLGFHC